MWNRKQIVLVVLLTVCVLSKSADLDLRPESQTAVAVEQAKLINRGKLILSRAVNCTGEGAFPINCTDYKVCYPVGGGLYIGAVDTCAPYNFNPNTLRCDPNYVCPICTKPGFICLSGNSFTCCSDALVVIVHNVTCPSDHFCNEHCKLPCTKFVINC